MKMPRIGTTGDVICPHGLSMDPEMEFRQHLADQQQRVATNDSTAANNYDEFQPNSSPNWITSLEEELDKKILVILRDGKNLIGVLRSFDQFGNLMLEGCVHRIIVNTFYNDVYQGVMIIRGENILLFGALDESKPNPLESRPLWEVLEMHEEQGTNSGPVGSPRKNPLRHALCCCFAALHAHYFFQEKHESRRRRNLRRLGDFLYGYDLPDE